MNSTSLCGCNMIDGITAVMAKAYTTDGGHLNPAGQQHAGQQLLTTLATLH